MSLRNEPAPQHISDARPRDAQGEVAPLQNWGESNPFKANALQGSTLCLRLQSPLKCLLASARLAMEQERQTAKLQQMMAYKALPKR